jgi:hypothetical protein
MDELNSGIEVCVRKCSKYVSGRLVRCESTDVDMCKETTYKFALNPFLCNVTWCFFKYSFNDICSTLEAANQQQLGFLAIKYDVECVKADFKASSHDRRTIERQGRTRLLKLLKEKIRSDDPTLCDRKDVCIRTGYDGGTPLPLVTDVTAEEYADMQRCFGNTIQENHCYPSMFIFRGLQTMPYMMDHSTNMLLLVVVHNMPIGMDSGHRDAHALAPIRFQAANDNQTFIESPLLFCVSNLDNLHVLQKKK